MTTQQHKIKPQQQRRSDHNPASPPRLSSSDTSRSVFVDTSSSTCSFAKPYKRLTSSRSIIKRRLGQRPAAASESNASSSASGINIVRKKLSKSASFSRRPVVVRTRLTPKLLRGVDNQSQDSSLGKATCSSKFKSTLFPIDPLEAATHICPYTYCSLHGVARSQGPQLKRFGSLSRRASRTYNHKVVKPKLSEAARGEHKMSNTTRSIPNNHIQSENIRQKTKCHFTNQHLQLEEDGHSDCCSPIPLASHVVTKDETQEELKLSNMATSASRATDKSTVENEKNTRVWRLIYHSILSAKYRSETYDEVITDKQLQGEGITAAPSQANTSKVESTETITVAHTVESAQMDAIKLVEDAIDELFLPEVEEQLSDNQTIISSEASERDLKRSNPDDISCMVEHCPTYSVKEVKPFSKMGSESMSKNWSKLKQVILLKRFVKALDKLHELKFKEPQILNVETTPEMETVSLKHQTTDEKRLADEWMLDYALRQAVAKLTPARRKKVELLIEAFETVIPLSKTEIPQSHNQSLSTFSVSSGHFSTDKTHTSYVPIKEVNQEGITITKDQGDTVLEPSFVLSKDALNLGGEAGSLLYQYDPPLHTETSPKHKITVVASGILDKFMANTQNFHKLELGMSSLHDQSSTGLKGQFDEELMEHMELKSIPSPVCSFDSVYTDKVTKIASDVNHKIVQESPLLGNSGNQTEFHAQLDNQKYFKMWGMIYNHVVSGSAAKIGSQLHIIESDDSREAMDSKLDAVKLVEDALDEMLLPEYQGPSSDEQSITSDQDHLERVDSESRDSEISSPKDSVSFYFKDVSMIKAKTPGNFCTRADDDVTTQTQQSHMTDKKGSKTNRLRSNGWSNLKKFILLKRFIRALDKLKKFNPRAPENLCLEPDPELEKVSLKRQTTADRLSADQWMIDHAIQQVVARLTPARKRRVELLVEAFETVEAVLPLSNTKMPHKHNSPSAAHATLF